MEQSSNGWKELHLPSGPECPKLFYNFDGTHSRIELYITDLVAIWAARLDTDDVLKEAKKQQSSIDPSESRWQNQVLMQRLQQSLADGNNQLIQNVVRKEQFVKLQTLLELPKPLKPLAWIFTLEQQNAGVLAEQILRPCLEEASASKHKTQSLLNVIKAKDHVIAKLLERIENSGTDLSLIFPGITGLKSRKGTITAAEAKKHVSGLAEFDESDWQSHFESNGSYGGFDRVGLQNLISGCDVCPEHTVQQHERWFEALPDNFSNPKSSSETQVHASSTKGKRQDSVQEEDEDTVSSDNDEFERQATPPGLESRQRDSENDENRFDNSKPTRRARSSSDASTATETASEDEQIKATNVKKGSKLGRLGPKKQTASQQNNTHSSSSDGSLSRSADVNSASSEQLEPHSNKHKSTNSRPTPQSPPKTRQEPVEEMGTEEDKSEEESRTQSSKAPLASSHRLGRLRGSNKPTTGSSAKSRSSVLDQDESSPSVKEETAESQSQQKPPTSSKTKAKSPTPKAEETVEQKVSRRRKELKETITAAPVRKRRKF